LTVKEVYKGLEDEIQTSISSEVTKWI